VLVTAQRVGRAVHTVVISDADRDHLQALKQGARRERAPAAAYYELPVEYPKVLPGPVTHDMRLRSYKNWHTEVGTTAAWQQHVCAVCNLNNWEQEMHTRPFTVRSLMRSICGVPVPAVEWPWDKYIVESASDDNTIATGLGWSDAIWCGAEALGEKLCAHYPSHDIIYIFCKCRSRSVSVHSTKWLSGRLPTVGTKERAFADKYGLSDGWRDRAQRLRAGNGGSVVDQLRTRRDGRPSTTFCGFQLTADAVVSECRDDIRNYTNERMMATQCQFRVCKECHSALCAGKTATLPKDAIANGNNYGYTLWQPNACARPGAVCMRNRRSTMPEYGSGYRFRAEDPVTATPPFIRAVRVRANDARGVL
jgi:hypothetical protein